MSHTQKVRTILYEDGVRQLLDGLPYHKPLASERDACGNKVHEAYEIRNEYDGNLVGRMETTWTYWDQAGHIVKDMVVDDGIGIRRRTIVHHKKTGEPEWVETLIVEPVPGLVERTLKAIIAKLGG
jgi:hypothetical protein